MFACLQFYIKHVNDTLKWFHQPFQKMNVMYLSISINGIRIRCAEWLVKVVRFFMSILSYESDKIDYIPESILQNRFNQNQFSLLQNQIHARFIQNQVHKLNQFLDLNQDKTSSFSFLSIRVFWDSSDRNQRYQDLTLLTVKGSKLFRWK